MHNFQSYRIRRLIKNDICSVQAIVSAIFHVILVQLPGHLHKGKASHAVRLLHFFYGSDWSKGFPILKNYNSLLFILFASKFFFFLPVFP